MRNLRIAALLLLVYGLALVINFASWYRWTGETAGFIRVAVRLAGTLLIAYGLWKAERWAWWVAVVFSAVLALSGVVGLAALRSAGALDVIPNPPFYIAFLGISIVVLAAACLVLLTPSGRRAALTRLPPAS